MRLYIISFLCFVFTGSFSQTQYLGSPTGTVITRGTHQVDSIFYLPKVAKTPSVSGAFRYQTSDSTVYVYTGTQWLNMGVNSTFSGDILVNNMRVGTKNLTDGNTYVGTRAGDSAISGSHSNTLIGFEAGRYIKTNNRNTYVGRRSGSGTSIQTSASSRNTAIGDGSLKNINSGDDNNAFGTESLAALTTGNDNTVVGSFAMSALTTGVNNTAIGTSAASFVNNGNNNTFIGHSSAIDFKGNSNVFIGYGTGGYFDSADNRLVIHNNGDTDPLIHGNFAADSLRINGALSVRDVARNNSPQRLLVFDSANGKLQSRDLNTISSQFLRTETANYTAVSTDHTILVDASSAAVTITLPAASGLSGKIYTIKRINSGGHNVTVDANASETIDGSTTNVLNSHYKYIQIQCDGSNWFIIANN